MSVLSFPHNIFEFQQQFATEAACLQYLYESRWSNGFVCPVCGDTEGYWIKTRAVVQCVENKHQISVTDRTVMHRTKQPLRLWFWAAYFMTTKTTSISAVQLQRQLGLKRYETAFNMLHKLRAATFRPQREKLVGMVEVDETYIGGVTRGQKRGRGTAKAIVVAAVERREGVAGRVRLRKVSDTSSRSLIGFIQDVIEPGSIVLTDGFPSYGRLSEYGYQHRILVQGTPEQSTVVLPLVHRVFSNLKAWVQGTFHGAISKKHLQAYLNEFVFRFNRRKTPMAAFQTILGIGSHVRGPTYEGLYQGTWRHPNPKKKM